jgi:hypothetical protein
LISVNTSHGERATMKSSREGAAMRQRCVSTIAAVASVAATLLAASPAVAGQDLPALSKATLDYTLSVTCTLTSPSGSSNVPCSSTLWNVSLQPGWSATMAATWGWHYTDDGLPLERGGTLLITGSGPSAGGARPALYESAGIYAQALPICGRGGCSPRPPNMSGDLGFLAVFESDNSMPDDITGSRTLTVTATWSENEVFDWTGQFGFFQPPGYPYFTVNSAPPIPEPSTWALFGVSLAALAFVRRRRMPRD